MRLRRSLAVMLCVSAASVSHAGSATWVDIGAEWEIFQGFEEPSPDGLGGPSLAWTEPEFATDASWFTGASGVGYGDADDQTVLADMQGSYASVYLRHAFIVPDPTEVTDVALRIDYDDGFVAYLNGVEIARSGLSGVPPPFDELASSHEAGTPELYLVDSGLLLPGTNVLAIQGHNTTLDSSDFSLIPELLADPDLCPDPASITCTRDIANGTVRLDWTNTIAYDWIEIHRNGEVIEPALFGSDETFVDRAPLFGETADYAVVAVRGDAACPPLECSAVAIDPADVLLGEGDEWSFQRGIFEPLPDWTEPDFDPFDWEVGPVGIGYGDGDDNTVLDDMQEIAGVQTGYLAVFARRSFERPAEDDELRLAILYDDGVAVWLNGVEVARANLPAGLPGATTAAVAAAAEPSYLEVTLDPALLTPGENVLAMSVHNVSLTSSDLSFLPFLYRAGTTQAPEPRFERADVNGDDALNLSDAVAILLYLFIGGVSPSCPDAADVDDSGTINLTDAVRILSYLFLGGPPPEPPFPDCGVDPTADALGVCEPAPSCG